jgi:hypothetical protein
VWQKELQTPVNPPAAVHAFSSLVDSAQLHTLLQG